MSAAEELLQVDYEGIFRLAAEDGLFFASHFFARTMRQKSAQMHVDLWLGLEEQGQRYFGAEIFRGGAKTATTRIYTAKRISYGLSRTILFISKSSAHAVRSVRWLKRQISINSEWTNFFGLRKGSKWTDDEIEIIHEHLGIKITVMAAGITGQIRGINTDDDFRPDLIVVDDPNDEENSATEEQRKKMNDLFFGSLQNSLVPPTENPHAKMVLLATSLDSADLINQAHKSSNWKTVKFPCFVLHPDKGEISAWEERFPTEFLKKERQAMMDRGQYYLWTREMECKIVAPEGAAFNVDLLRYYQTVPEVMRVFMAIDPARSKQKSAHKCAICAIGVYQTRVYTLEYFAQKGMNPEEIWQKFYEMSRRWGPERVAIETVAYQQALSFYFSTKMRENNYFVPIHEYEDRRSKSNRIRQAIGGRLVHGQLYIKSSMTDLVKQLAEYRDGIDFDLLDALAIAIDEVTPMIISSIDGEFERLEDFERDVKSLEYSERSMCP